MSRVRIPSFAQSLLRRLFFQASWPSGKAAVCKTAMHQFESGRRLHFCRGGEIGRHKGLKIPRNFIPCEFDSRPRYIILPSHPSEIPFLTQLSQIPHSHNLSEFINIYRKIGLFRIHFFGYAQGVWRMGIKIVM